MFRQRRLVVSLALVLLTASASAASLMYVVSGNQFGTIDLATGAYQQIGPSTALDDGLVAGPNGSLLTLTFGGNLDSINPVTGVVSLVGPTGLASCATPASPCGPTSANTLGEVGGTIYATDFHNNLYTVNPMTGHATLIGPTGIPAVPAIPDSGNPDGTFNAFDSSLFGAGGKLYATFDAIKVKPSPFSVTSVIPSDLYQINPSTGVATLVAPTALTLGAAFDVNGTTYTFDDMTGQILILNLTNGNTTVVGNFDPAAGVIDGATPDTPEPASVALAGVGILLFALYRCRVRRVGELWR